MRDESTRRTADGATVICCYVLVLVLVPARLIISKIPMTLAPITVLAVGIAVLWGCAHLVRTLGMSKGRTAVRSALLLLFASQLVTYGIASRRYLPPDELNLTDSGMLRVVGVIAVAVFACDAIGSRERLDRVLRFLVVVVAVMAGTGVLQFALGLDVTRYLNLPGLTAQTGYDAIQSRSLFRRPSGTTNHPIEFGLICAIVTPLAGHHVFLARETGRRAGGWWLCLALIAGGALVSVSRTAVLGLVVGAVVLIVALPGRRKVHVLGAGVLFGGGAGLMVPGLLGTFYELFANFGEDPSITSRTKDYDQAWRQVALHPWFGRGFGTYLPGKYQLLDNQYLLTLIENGWVGVIAMIAVFLAAVWATVLVRVRAKDLQTRGLAAALMAGVVVGAFGAFTFDLLSFGVATGLVFVVVGACGALARHPRPPEPATGSTTEKTAVAVG
ncbi:O-antigen ligase family protein [Umezawaea beigongshangensis]|uniref:O-antigen ligase family protein n=1 Tax=Umezawaea beigongshangensis TaxID=2780383 RepID=UPI0018F1A80E|nr:O-antigen ligase family protein [Umezawaea beigongshangensis]